MQLEELYQTIILEHYKEPHNFGEIKNPDIEERGYNESCGDDVKVFVKLINENKIDSINFIGKGCAISQASTSMLTDVLKGKSIEEAIDFIENFKSMMKGEKDFISENDFEELSAMKGVLQFPVRVKCATLAWNTLKNGLIKYQNKQ